MRRLLIGLATAGLFALGLPATTAQASYPGGNGLIAFTDFAAGGQIFTIRSDGTGRRQLTHFDAPAGSPSWSADGRRIIFNSFTDRGSRLFVMNADGSHLRRIGGGTPGLEDFEPTYSPDMTRIAYSRCTTDGESCSLWVEHADASHQRQLTPQRGGAFWVDWSPNGRYLAYGGLDKFGYLAAVYVRPASGPGRAHRVTPPRLLAGIPDWSPDGRNLLFTSDVCCGRVHSHLYTVHPDGSGLRQLTHTDFRHQDFFGVYSPDGRKLVFSSDRAYRRDPNNGVDLWVANADGSRAHRITGDHGIAIFADWQPLH